MKAAWLRDFNRIQRRVAASSGEEISSDHKGGVAAGNDDPLDEFVIEQVLVSERRGTPRQSAASAAFSVALGRIAADVLAESGR